MSKIFKKAVLVLLTCTFSLSTLWAQAPEKMSYQAVIRSTGGTLVISTQIGMEINIRQGSESGTVVYTETQTPTTNANGLVSIEIGGGAGFNTINWGASTYFIETKTAVVAPLTTYTITGVSQLLSVPYALNAKTADNGITTQQATAITTNTAKVSAATGTAPGQMQYWNGTAWVVVAATINEGAALQMIGGIPTWVGGTPPTTPNVTNPTTGKIWMDRNLGASQVATSSTDAASYGDLYQWGRGADGHQIRTSLTTPTNATTAVPNGGNSWDGLFITEGSSPYDWLTPQDNNLWQGVSGTNNPCPSGYRLPTEAEWNAERTSWGSNNNATGAFASPLKLPVAGHRDGGNGSLGVVGSGGYYWSSTVDGTLARELYFVSSNAFMFSNSRALGFSVRCLKD